MTQPPGQPLHHGRCLCGDVRVVARGAPAMVAICHCPSCRRHTGAPFAVYADYGRDCVSFTGTEPARYASSAGVERRFCARCGSTISYHGANLPEMIHLHIGLFDDADAFVPVQEEGIATRLCWLETIVARD